MGRHKSITDESILRIAREVFKSHGHTATTRQIAAMAGISEAILYQRFGSKDDLFFAAMRPSEVDVEEILGPAIPSADGREFARTVTTNMARHFAAVIPEALRLMTHPSFDHGAMHRSHPQAHAILHRGLATRLASLIARQAIRETSIDAAARLLIALAHDSALSSVVAHRAAPKARDVHSLVDVIWEGLRPK